MPENLEGGGRLRLGRGCGGGGGGWLAKPRKWLTVSISIEIDSPKKPYGPGREWELHLEVGHQMPHQIPPFKNNEFEEQEP